MRIVYGVLLCLVLSGCVVPLAPLDTTVPPAQPIIVVNGTASTTIMEWCGSLPASAAERANVLPHRVPFGGKTLYVRNATITGMTNTWANPIMNVTTDSDGNFRMALPPGDYCIVGDEKLHLPEKENEVVDPRNGDMSARECLQQWWEKCDYGLTVPVSQQEVPDANILFLRYCYHSGLPDSLSDNPCVSAIGTVPQ